MVSSQSLWEPIVGGGAVVPAGFGDPLNYSTTSISSFNEQSFFGVACVDLSIPQTCPMEIWSIANDGTWTMVTDTGFGNPSNWTPYTMIEFLGHFYVGTSGGEILRTPNGIDWERVVDDGFGEPQGVFELVIFDGHLYAGTGLGSAGAQIWRSSDGSSWTQVEDDGFGDALNVEVDSMEIFDQRLFVALAEIDIYSTNPYDGQCEIWSSDEGTSWTKFSDCPGQEGNYAAYAMAAFDGFLFVGTSNYMSGGQIWRTVDGSVWDQVADDGPWFLGYVTAMAVHDDQLFAAAGDYILVTDNGVDWDIYRGDGFGNTNNHWISSASFAGDFFYAGTQNTSDGTEIWRTAKRLFGDGFENGDTTAWSATEPPPRFPLVINEIMQNPSAVPDTDGEWFEIFNPDTNAVDVNGWTISDNDTDSHTIVNGGPLEVPAGGFLVLGVEGDEITNGGVMVDYVYSNITLANTSDELVLKNASAQEVDRVEWDDGVFFPDPTGASMALADPAANNNHGPNWCISTSVFGDGDLGTPGAVNDACP